MTFEVMLLNRKIVNDPPPKKKKKKNLTIVCVRAERASFEHFHILIHILPKWYVFLAFLLVYIVISV